MPNPNETNIQNKISRIHVLEEELSGYNSDAYELSVYSKYPTKLSDSPQAHNRLSDTTGYLMIDPVLNDHGETVERTNESQKPNMESRTLIEKDLDDIITTLEEKIEKEKVKQKAKGLKS